MVESANKGMKVFDMGQFDFFVFLSDSFILFSKAWA